MPLTKAPGVISLPQVGSTRQEQSRPAPWLWPGRCPGAAAPLSGARPSSSQGAREEPDVTLGTHAGQALHREQGEEVGNGVFLRVRRGIVGGRIPTVVPGHVAIEE